MSMLWYLYASNRTKLCYFLEGVILNPQQLSPNWQLGNTEILIGLALRSVGLYKY